MLSNLFSIQGKLYMSDFTETDLQRFHKVYGYDDIAKSINLGARDLRASNSALVPVEPKVVTVLDTETKQFAWTF